MKLFFFSCQTFALKMTSRLLELMVCLTCQFKQQKTVSRDETPKEFWLAGIETGYRVDGQTPWYYLKSMFQIHNETINIWSHLVGCGVLAYNMFWCINCIAKEQNHDYWFVLIAFGVSSMMYTFLSSMAHTFHTISPLHHNLCFMMDYAGIGYYILGLSILIYYCSCNHVYYSILEPIILPISVFFCWFGFLCSCVSRLTHNRTFLRRICIVGSFGLQIAFVICISMTRYFSVDGGHSNTALEHYTKSIIYMVLFAAFYSSGIPEKYFPGKFDIIGQSHQIFHVLSIFANVEQFVAVVYDVKEYSPEKLTNHHPCPIQIGMALFAYTIGVFFVFIFLPNLTREKIKKYK